MLGPPRNCRQGHLADRRVGPNSNEHEALCLAGMIPGHGQKLDKVWSGTLSSVCGLIPLY